MVVKLLKMSAGVFEPLFFLGLLWLGLQLPVALISRKNALRCAMLLGTLFILAWRMSVHLWAGHYASLLIIVLTLWCVDTCRAFAENRFLNRWYIGKAIALLIFGVLVYACISKNLRINRHADYIIRCAELIRRDAQNTPGAVIWNHNNTLRMEYYSKLPAISNLDLVTADFDSLGLKRFVSQYEHCGYPIYMVLDEPGKGGSITAESLGLQKSQWRFLGSFYKNNKEKVSACAYFFDGTCGAKRAPEAISADYCRRYSRHMIRNGCFEHVMSDSQLQSFSAQADKTGLTFWRNGTNHPFPNDWSIFYATPFRDKNGEIELTTDALEGAYSLRIKSNDLVSAFAMDMLPAEDGEISFLACGKPGSQFELYLHLYGERNKWSGCPRLAVFLSDGNTRLYQVAVTKKQLRGAKYYRLCPAVRKGEVRLDAFSVRLPPSAR